MPAVKKITINLSFYNQNEVLKKHVLGWKSYPEETKGQFSFCIVDDCSKTNAVEVLKDMDLSDLDINIYRVEEDLFCNIAGVRNLSAKVCQTEWMVILDMDTMISSDLAEKMLELSKSDSGNCFKFNRRDPNGVKNNQAHPAVCLLKREDYWNVGGCEEDLVGNYGYTDPSFWHRAQGKIRVHTLGNAYLDYITAGEAKITRNTSHNGGLFVEKTRKNNWSTDFIRFKWKKIL